MSTEHQRYSTENQADAIAQYAGRFGFEIVRTYADNGKSGLRIEGRDALRQLLSDVECGSARFKAILVYDVSRWGRFQDVGERVRDKIAASKKKGMWMGGVAPLGYAVTDRRLIVLPEEAETVRTA